MTFLETGLRGYVSTDHLCPTTDMEKPKIVGCFSLNKNREYEYAAKCCTYFRMPDKIPFDLNECDTFWKPGNDVMDEEGLDNLLQFIHHHQDEFLCEGTQPDGKAVGNFNFICFRGVLRKIMCTPYDLKDDWSIQATKFMGNIYLIEKETEAQCQWKWSHIEDMAISYSFGVKFKQFCLTKNPMDESRINVPLDELEAFYCVYKSKLQDMELLYRARVDGIMSDKICTDLENKDVLNAMKLVELKCINNPDCERLWNNFFRYKCRTWWCQGFLSGIHDFMIGYRNEKGIVQEFNHVKVNTLPSSCFNRSQCVDFLVRFLQTVKTSMRHVNCPHTVYEFYCDADSRRINYRVYEGKSLHSTLPDWYVSLLQRRCG